MRIRSALVPLVAAVALVAGCTNEPAEPAETPLAQLGAADILAKAKEATADAKSFKATGTGTSEGQEIKVDLVMNDGKMSMAFNTTVEGLGEMAIQIVTADGVTYMKLPDTLMALFTMTDPDAAAAVAGKWLKVDTNDPTFGSLADMGDFGNLDEADPVSEFDAATVTKGEVETINGVEAVPLTNPDGLTIYIATTGEPYPVRQKDDEFSLDYSDWGNAPEVTVPPEDQVFDAANLADMFGGATS